MGSGGGVLLLPLYKVMETIICLIKVVTKVVKNCRRRNPGRGVKYDIVHMRDKAFSKQPLGVWLFTKKRPLSFSAVLANGNVTP